MVEKLMYFIQKFIKIMHKGTVGRYGRKVR